MAWAKPDGAFEFVGLSEGRYRLRVDSHDRAVRVLERVVNLTAGQHLDGVELAL